MVTALRSALAPSITMSILCSGSKPRLTRSSKRPLTTVEFSVAPCHRPRTCFLPRRSSGDQTITAKEFAVDHQHQQLLGDGSLQQLVQLVGRRCFPVSADAGFGDAIARQTIIDSSGIVARRALANQLSRYRLLQFAIALKALIALKANLLIISTAQARPLQFDLATSKDDESWLMAVAPHRLLTPLAGPLLDLGLHHPLDDRQPQLRCKGFHIIAHPRDQCLHRQLSLHYKSFTISCFFFGLFCLPAVWSHRWFSWLFVYFYTQPSILFDERQENHFHFQLGTGLPREPKPKFFPKIARFQLNKVTKEIA